MFRPLFGTAAKGTRNLSFGRCRRAIIGIGTVFAVGTVPGPCGVAVAGKVEGEPGTAGSGTSVTGPGPPGMGVTAAAGVVAAPGVSGAGVAGVGSGDQSGLWSSPPPVLRLGAVSILSGDEPAGEVGDRFSLSVTPALGAGVLGAAAFGPVAAPSPLASGGTGVCAQSSAQYRSTMVCSDIGCLRWR